MTMSDRGIHPDLIEEELAEREAAPAPSEEPQGARGRRRAAPRSNGSTPPAVTPEAPERAGDSSSLHTDEPPGPTEPPEWFASVREASDPSEALKLLLKNLPRDQVERDEVISGLIGQVGDRRARELIRQQQRDLEEQAKLEAARNNDLYTLGELTQKEYQERLNQQQAAQAASPFMDGVVLFQQTLDPSIQEKIGGRIFGEGKGQAAGVAEYLQTLHDEAVKLAVEKELQRRESALRKSVLSEVYGDEQVPERESGTPGRVREVTDEQIEAMSMREYEALFDENGKPKPGVRHRSTRGIPLTQR